MSISLEEVRHVARLARLDLAETEVVALQNELNALLGHFSDIRDLDVSAYDAASHAVALSNVWADDEAEPGLTREEALRNAPLSKAGLFLVPMIVEE